MSDIDLSKPDPCDSFEFFSRSAMSLNLAYF